MLEYNKLILTKMSFDQALFAKELAKAIDYMQTDERILLKDWCYQEFGHKFRKILDKKFKHPQFRRQLVA